MLSGTIYGSFANKATSIARPYITWTATQNIAGNYTDITFDLHFWKADYSYFSYNAAAASTVNIDGQTAGGTINYDMRGNFYEKVVRSFGAIRVYHNADGTRTAWIGSLGDTTGGWGPYNFGETVTLDTIPREAYITNAVDFTIGNDIPLTITNTGNMYLKIILYASATNGGYTSIKTVNAGQVSSYNLSPTTGEKNAIYALIPNQTSGYCSVRVMTYSDAGYTNQIGGNRDQTGIIDIDQAANAPTFTTYTVANVDKSVVVQDIHGNTLVTSSTATLLGSSADRMIAGISKIRAAITAGNKMVAKNSATPSKYRFVNNGVAVEGAYSGSAEVDIDIDNVSVNDFTVTAYDSRNLTTAVGKAISLVAQYSQVNAYGLTLTRANNVDALTTMAFSGVFWNKYFSSNTTSNPGNGVLNTVTAHWRYKLSTDAWGAQSWTAITPTADGSGNLNFSAQINGDLGAAGFDTTKSFDIEVRLYDKLSSIVIIGSIPVGTPLMDLTPSGVAFGKKYDNTKGGAIQVLGNNILNILYPVGSIYLNASDGTNPGTLLGFGTWTAFGAGRVPVGKAAAGTFNTIGATMGEETHALSVAELASHNHSTSSDGAHNHTVGVKEALAYSSSGSHITVVRPRGYGSDSNQTVGNNDDGAHNHSITSAGSGTAHNNIQPSVVVYMWQRTA